MVLECAFNVRYRTKSILIFFKQLFDDSLEHFLGMKWKLSPWHSAGTSLTIHFRRISYLPFHISPFTRSNVSRKVFSVISSKLDKNINPAPENINKRYFLNAGVEEIFRKFIHNPFGSLAQVWQSLQVREIFSAFPRVGLFKTLLRSHTGWINFLLARKTNPENESNQTASHTCCARLNGICLCRLIRIMMLFVYTKPKWIYDH